MEKENWVAWYGAIVATIAVAVSTINVVWNIRRDRKNRGILQLRASFMVAIGAPTEMIAAPQVPTGEFLLVRATNIGHRPLAVECVYARRKTPDETGHDVYLFKDSVRSVRLEEGKSEPYVGPLRGELPFEELKCICAEDSTGKAWKLPRRLMRRLVAEERAALREKEKQGD